MLFIWFYTLVLVALPAPLNPNNVLHINVLIVPIKAVRLAACWLLAYECLQHKLGYYNKPKLILIA